MQVDNSGSTVVLDAKTSQAIDEGKNRITMLQVEELRLKNLKKSLEAEIINLEADIDYKENKLVELGSMLDVQSKELELLEEQINHRIEDKDTLDKYIETREKGIAAKEIELHEKELSLDAEQTRLDDLIEKTETDSVIAEKAKNDAYEKVKKIDDFLKSL